MLRIFGAILILCAGFVQAAEPIAVKMTVPVTATAVAAKNENAAVPVIFKEGEHYTRLSSSVANKGPIGDLRKKYAQKVQIVEFFSYGCGACFMFQPTFEAWLKGFPAVKKVEVVRVPVVFHHSWEPLARAYFLLEGFDAVHKGHEALFNGVQVQHLNLTEPVALQSFLATLGISKTQFDNTYRSFTVDNKMKTAQDLAKAYKITAIPAIMVNGPQGVFVPSQKLYPQELLAVIEFLVKQQIQQLPSQK